MTTLDLAHAPSLPLVAPDVMSNDGGTVCALSQAEFTRPSFLAAWEELITQACEPNPYFEPWFILPSFEQFTSGTGQNTVHHGDKPSDKHNVLAVYDGNAMIGLIPMAVSMDYYGNPVPHLKAWLHDNAFCGAPLIAKGSEELFWQKLLHWCDRNPGRATFLHLPHLPADGPANAALNAVLDQTGRKAADVHKSARAMLASDATPSEYLEASMSTKKRKELRRQRKRLEDHGVLVIERASGIDRIESWIADFLALEAAGWKGDAGSALASASQTEDFFSATLSGAAQAGRLDRLSMLLDGRPIAMLANFITPPGAYSFKTTFDEAFARFSPGLLLQIENLEMLARADVEWTDSCAVQGHSMIERIWREKRRMVSRNIAIGGPLRRLIFAGLMAYETRGQHKNQSTGNTPS
ncbi:MAG: GNAT family N-acetyltransferase [Erythrobacter sp.]